jgi:hypothetical protein
MKKYLVISLCVFFSLPAHTKDNNAARRSNGLLRFLAETEGVRDIALSLVMNTRCDRYLAKESTACQESVTHQLRALDYDVLLNPDSTPQLLDQNNPKSFVFVAFKNQLKQLLNREDTNAYLQMINSKLTRFMTGEDPVPANLWTASVAFYGSEKFAITSLATLFQDTSINKLHLAWLERSNTRGNEFFTENKELLSRVIDTINFIMDSAESHYRTLFYPPSVQGLINRNIYHFYVPYYVTMKLIEQGMKRTHALMGPLMLTLTYEFMTSAPDLRYVFQDPPKVSQQSKMDIYGGYAGGRLGAERPLASFRDVSAAFDKGTTQGVAALLK